MAMEEVKARMRRKRTKTRMVGEVSWEVCEGLVWWVAAVGRSSIGDRRVEVGMFPRVLSIP
jgi:hypothetical protein